MTAPAVEMREVVKDFGGVRALAGVDLRVEPGEVVAFLGPNGAGKTTAISIMLGLRKPSSGEVRLLGHHPRDLRPRSRVGVMLQESGVPGELRVREVIDLFRSYYPQPLPRDEVIERADLGEKERARAGSLSGGQRQRLYFALAICGDPEVLFLDEPTVGLDIASRRRFWEQVRDSVESGKTIVLTTHYLEEADALADRIVVIDHGRIIADGSAYAIKSRVMRKHVHLETGKPLRKGIFNGLPMGQLEVTGNSVNFVSPNPEEVLKKLFVEGVEVSNLEVLGANLEEAFLELTEGRG